MASAKSLAAKPLPQFVADRIKVWDELKAKADEASAGACGVSANLRPC